MLGGRGNLQLFVGGGGLGGLGGELREGACFSDTNLQGNQW